MNSGLTKSNAISWRLTRNTRRFRPGAARFFLTEDAYSYVELNGESPAGIAFADSATEIFQADAGNEKVRGKIRCARF